MKNITIKNNFINIIYIFQKLIYKFLKFNIIIIYIYIYINIILKINI